MRKLLIQILTLTILISCSTSGDKEFKINGKVDGLSKGKVILKKRGDNGFFVIDTAVIIEGEFQFIQPWQQPEAYYMKIEEYDPIIFLAGDNDVKIDVNIDNTDGAVITGSVAQDQYMSYKNSVADIDSQMDELYNHYKEARKNDNMAIADSLDKMMDDLYEEKGKFLFLFH